MVWSDVNPSWQPKLFNIYFIMFLIKILEKIKKKKQKLQDDRPT